MSELGPSAVAANDVQISVDEARAEIARAVTAIDECELVALEDASARVLAADVLSPINVPAHDNSAMDGYEIGRAHV